MPPRSGATDLEAERCCRHFLLGLYFCVGGPFELARQSAARWDASPELEP